MGRTKETKGAHKGCEGLLQREQVEDGCLNRHSDGFQTA